MDELFACPACRFLSLSEVGRYEICEVCGWEDDPVQSCNPELPGGANLESLHEYRANMMQRFPEHVREAVIGLRKTVFKRDPA
jgi:hypothetical protein